MHQTKIFGKFLQVHYTSTRNSNVDLFAVHFVLMQVCRQFYKNYFIILNISNLATIAPGKLKKKSEW